MYEKKLIIIFNSIPTYGIQKINLFRYSCFKINFCTMGCKFCWLIFKNFYLKNLTT